MTASTGIDRRTGKPLSDWPHVRQSLGMIFTTRLSQRVLARLFGFAGVGLLGQPLTPGDLMKFYLAVVIAVELWEPRFAVTSLTYPAGDNSATGLGQGRFGVRVVGAYRPNALTGDFTVAATVSVIL